MSATDEPTASSPPVGGPTTAVLVCDGCGATTTHRERFVRTSRGGDRSVLCPACLERRSTRSGRTTVIVVGALFALGLVLHQTETGVIGSSRGAADIGLALMYVAAVYLATFVHVVPHELGHAVAGRLMRFRVPRVVIGVGAPVLERRIGGTWFDLRSFPVCGLTMGATDDRRLLRTRLWLFVVGGPLATFVGTAMAWRLATDVPEGPVRFVLVSLANGGLIVLVGSLIPLRRNGQATDGLALLTTPFLGESRIDQIVETEATTDLREHMRRGDHDEAIAVARRRFEHEGGDADAHLLLVANLVAAERWPEAVPALRDHLARFDAGADARAVLLSDLAWAGVVDPGLVPLTDADAASAEAFELAPWNHAVAGTRGCVLIETGRVAEGIELVQASLLPTYPPASRAATQAYLAIGTARLDNLWAARPHLDEARRAAAADPGSAAAAELVRRATDEVACAGVRIAIRAGWTDRGEVAPDPEDPRAIARITARQPDELARLVTEARHLARARSADRAADVIAAGLGTALPDALDPVDWLLAFATSLDTATRSRRPHRP